MPVYSRHLVVSYHSNSPYFVIFITVLCSKFGPKQVFFRFIFFILNILLITVELMILPLELGYIFVLIMCIFTSFVDNPIQFEDE
jgi:hypothetical protein